MVVQVLLELEHRDWPEFTIHTSAKLLQRGGSGSFSSPGWLTQSGQDLSEVMTTFGLQLHDELEDIGVSTMYGGYAIQVRVPRVFNMFDTLDQILEAFRRVIARSTVHEKLAFGVTVGDNVFERTELKEEPTRAEVDAMVQAIVPKLDVTPVRKYRGMTDAERAQAESRT